MSMTTSARRLLVVIALSMTSVNHAGANEPWADPRLPVQEGLVGWYDAGRLPEYRKSVKSSPLTFGERLEVWPDASGKKRDLRQADAAARPVYVDGRPFPAVRFDGRDSHLRLSRQGEKLAAMTVFVVAAPYANEGAFAGLLAAGGKGRNDYTSGFNLDLGPWPTSRVQVLNLEGAGQQGVKNLLADPADFGTVLRICVTTSPGPNGSSLWLNGKRQGQRDRAQDTTIATDELVVGARIYTNGGAPQPRGSLEGDIAEVILFDRALSDKERAEVDAYLDTKYGKIKPLPIPSREAGSAPLVRVQNPPAVQMLLPGFEVRTLPINLTNINNLLYRPDGKLVALAYDGNVYLLSDTDGDGLEDKVERFWENKGELRGPIGMAFSRETSERNFGLVIASKGRITLLRDTDQDDRADKEQIIAEGWKELPHGVDALGVAVDPKDGAVFFGLGAQDFTDAYGKARKDSIPYSVSSERGAILRIAPDFQGRRVVATGIRFPVGIRFNQSGDLFCTDQEGATWLANGNPFDELLHVQSGRHYGFPPRHPHHLPSVIDEPSVFDYTPQHQSTCGLNFNEPVNGGPSFGPAWWRSDALVAGYARGKLYRTKLVKTSAGYVAQNQLFACLSMLPADVCVSPQGELVVATHSGGPDWGSGPTGKGKLFKITPTAGVPRPVVAWPQGPRETRIAFDRPLNPQQLAGLSAGVSIEHGAYVAAGDRFESLWPGYKAVADQLREPRFSLPVHSVQVSPDRRTLMITTAEHPMASSYAITLKGLGRPAKEEATAPRLPQLPQTDLAYSLTGVTVAWQACDNVARTLWFPSLDTGVARELTQDSQEHEAFWRTVAEGDTLTFQTTLDLENMLRPAVQPGSKIDYELPAETVSITLRSGAAFEVKAGDSPRMAVRESNSKGYVLTTTSTKSRLPVEVTMYSGKDGPDLRVSWSTAEDARPRALPLRRLILPWAPSGPREQPTLAGTDHPELKGGNWARGKAIFFGEQAACFKCHSVGGSGGKLAPDLSNLPQRDYESVHRDITLPSYAINPDFISQTIVLKDGSTLTGPVRTEGDNLLVSNNKGEVTTIAKDDVDEIASSKLSIMPEGLPKQLGPQRMKDLLVFLLTEPPRMPNYGSGKPPEPRDRKEIDEVLKNSQVVASLRPIQIVLVAGRKDHGPGEHDYPAWQAVWARLLTMAEGVVVSTATDWPSPQQLARADVLVFYQQGTWNPERARDIDAYLARGGGLVYLHYAVDGGKDAPGFAQRIGLAWQGGRSKFRHGLLDLGFRTDAGHPIARNFTKVSFHDESYWNLVGDRSNLALLAGGPEEGAEQPLFWTTEPANGRVVVSILGHFSWTFDDPLFRVLLLRSIAWTAMQPVDRFNDLVLPGARVAE